MENELVPRNLLPSKPAN